MGKFILMLVASLVFSITAIQHSMLSGVGEGEKQFTNYAAKVLAREIANTGLNEATQQVFLGYKASSSYTGPSTITGSHSGGTYASAVTSSGTSFTIKAVGTYQKVQYTIRRTFDYKPAPSGLPAFMGGPIMTDGNFVVKSNMTLSASPTENATIHANGNLRFESGTSLVKGFGHHGGNLEMLNGQSASSVFKPNVNPSGNPVTKKVSKITIPAFKADDYKSKATHQNYSDVTLSGNVMLGTATNPKIWYISGNLKTSGAVTFSGYGVFIVKGNVEMEHAVSQSGSATEGTVGMFVEGNILVKKPMLNIAGQWLLNGNILLEDNTNFTGSMTNLGNIYIEKKLNMTYRPASPALTSPFWPTAGSGTGGKIQLVSAQEW